MSSTEPSSSSSRGRLLFRLGPKASIFPPMILRQKQVAAVLADDFLVNDSHSVQTVAKQDDTGFIHNTNNDAYHQENTDVSQRDIQRMLRQLSPDELETAARFSYDYLTQSANKQNKHVQMHYAKKLAAIYLVKHSDQTNDAKGHENKDTAKRALADLKAALKFRKRFNVDALRTAFDKQLQLQQSDAEQDACISRGGGSGGGGTDSNDDFHETLYQTLGSKKLYVQGYDRDGRSTVIFIPRNVQQPHPNVEWTLREHVYTLERALACTKARDSKVNAIVDFNGFVRAKHAPPTMRMGLEFLNVLGDYYGPCVNRVFIVDAPVTFMVLWTMFKPIVHKLASRNKVNIEFVQSSSSSSKATKNGKNNSNSNHRHHHHDPSSTNVLERYYEPHQAASWMLPTGTKNRDLDIHEYLHQTPFNQAFDEKQF